MQTEKETWGPFHGIYDLHISNLRPVANNTVWIDRLIGLTFNDNGIIDDAGYLYQSFSAINGR